jgi:uncharacterized protein YkwD
MPPAALFSAVGFLLILLPLGARFGTSSSPSPDPAADTTATYEAERALCVSITNAYRASAGRTALTRTERLETYAAEAARHDGMLRQAHQYVNATNFGNGLVRAENELLWWPLSTYGTVRRIVEEGLAQMWNEAPGGSHRGNILGDYTEVGCGVFVNNGDVTLAQAFR